MSTNASTLEMSSAAAQPVGMLPMAVGFFLSFRLFSVLLAVRLLGADSQVGVEVSLVTGFLLFGATLFNSIGVATKKPGVMLRQPCYFWILCFVGFSGLSLAWSVAVSLSAAAVFWCALVADLATVVLLLRTGPVLDASSALMRGYVYGACCIAAVAWIMPAQSDLRLGDEELLGPNQIGYACAFAIFFTQYLMRSNQTRWKLFAVFLGITLLRSLSKTTIAAFLVGEAIVIIMNRSMSPKTKKLLIAGFLIVIAAFWSLLVSYYQVYLDEGNQSLTLSGRVFIWAYILNEAIDRPWIGHGFHSVWKVIPPFGSDQFEAAHAHNELLQQFYTYGIAGIVMMVGFYRSFYRQVKRLPASPLRPLLLGVLAFVLIRGLADTERFDLSLPLWAAAMFSAIMAEQTEAPPEVNLARP
jgi:exopolysaccharide production protein ExoQ